uniref:Uncharacterized protein n=1 Tax=Arundo donax TaxID=35708 RepID=A0A0A9DP82_ARUDO
MGTMPASFLQMIATWGVILSRQQKPTFSSTPRRTPASLQATAAQVAMCLPVPRSTEISPPQTHDPGQIPAAILCIGDTRSTKSPPETRLDRRPHRLLCSASRAPY